MESSSTGSTRSLNDETAIELILVSANEMTMAMITIAVLITTVVLITIVVLIAIVVVTGCDYDGG